ncbi:MAG: phosphatidylinositol-specific phospholipase C1-like protein [Pseudomonadales bacterium]|nr:phosphatidylinositol-specific phospholipase C1-like protein [Pseudomonadales bacterium]
MSTENALKFNEIQMLGSHNSYKKAIDPELMAVLRRSNPDVATTLDYAHLPLREQLDFGLRKLELDVFHDPEGGRYASPFGLQVVQSPSPWDSETMETPGYKVFHVQDIDFRSHCPLFRQCLREIRHWSEMNPGHIPLVITINAKDEAIDSPGFVVPMGFDEAAWQALDDEIREELGSMLFTPDDLRGDHQTLRGAVLAGWPTLDSMRGRILFVLDDADQKILSYTSGHASLRERVMFVNAHEDADEAAFRIVNEPRRQLAYIQGLVRQGFVVRTRADADTLEARRGDSARLEAALASGAQIISTDYYRPDERFDTGYRAELPGNVIARCNPVLITRPCEIVE